MIIEVLGEKIGREIVGKIEWHYTPKHAGRFWIRQRLSSIPLETQCLNRRIADFETMESEVAACVKKPNRDECQIDWQFTRKKAKEKIKPD